MSQSLHITSKSLKDPHKMKKLGIEKSSKKDRNRTLKKDQARWCCSGTSL